MALARDMRVVGTTPIAQQTGRALVLDPAPHTPGSSAWRTEPFTFPEPTGATVFTTDYDLVAGDIGNPIDTGESTPRCLFVMGDIFGTDIDFTSESPALLDDDNRGVHGTQGTTALSSLVGAQDVRIAAGNAPIPGWPTEGFVSFDTGTGPGGWAIVTYKGQTKVAGLNAVALNNCKLISGGGSIVGGTSRAAVGDPRTGGGFRGSAIFDSLDTSLSNGFTINRVKDSTDGTGDHVAREAFAYNPARSTQTRADVYPFLHSTTAWTSGIFYSVGTHVTYLGDTYRLLAPAAFPFNLPPPSEPTAWSAAFTPAMATAETFALDWIKVELGYIVGRISASSGVPNGAGQPTPSGPCFYLSGITSNSQYNASPFTSDALPSTGAVITNATTFVDSTYTAAERTVAIEATDGTFFLVRYTATSSYPALTGLTLDPTQPNYAALNTPAGRKTTFAGARVIQGVDAINALDWIVYDWGHDGNSRTFRISTNKQPRAGGRLTSATARLPHYMLNPAAAPTDAGISMGGCSVAKTGGKAWDNTTVTNRRMLNMRQSALFTQFREAGAPSYNNRCSIWYSDNGGRDWTEAPWGWDAATNFDSAITYVTPYTHTDGYVYAWALPGNMVMRCLETDLAKTPLVKADWQYYDGVPGAGGAWSSTIPSSVTAQRWSFWPSNNVQLYYSTTFSVWMATYSTGFGIACRFADTPEGPWGPERRIVDSSEYHPTRGVAPFQSSTGFFYGGWLHPFSERFGNGIYMLVTFYSPYQVFMVRVSLIELATGAANTMAEERHLETQYKGAAAKLIDPPLENPSIKVWGGWIGDTHTWTRTGANQITIVNGQLGTSDMATMIGKYARIKVQDNASGTPLVGTQRYAYTLSATASGNDTVLNLIPHNDGSSSGSILAAGTLANPAYSHADAPPGFPGCFAFPGAPTAGYSVVPTTAVYTYTIRGRMMKWMAAEGGVGTNSATTTHLYPLPSGCVTRNRANAGWGAPSWTSDSTINAFGMFGVVLIAGNSSSISSIATAAGGGYTGAGATSRLIRAELEFELT